MGMLSTASRYLTGYNASIYPSGGDQGGQTYAQPTAQAPSGYSSQQPSRSYSYSTSRPATSTQQSVSSTRTIRKGEAPKLPSLPTFTGPKVDKRAVRALTQKLAAPGIRTLREAVQASMGQNYENPNVRRMTLREALRGYGTGLESVMGGAGQQARSEHMQELQLQRDEAYQNWKAQTEAAMSAYSMAWQDYLKGEETVTTSQQSASEGPSGPTYTYRSKSGTLLTAPVPEHWL